MNIFDEINHALAEGKDAFTDLINQKLKSDVTLLSKSFITPRGNQQTILAYLIRKHSEQNNLQEHIDWLLHNEIDSHINEPLHLAFRLNKLDLIPLFLNEHHAAESLEPSQRKKFRLDSRDIQGKTLLYRIIERGLIKPLQIAVGINPEGINARDIIKQNQSIIDIQSIHHAIIVNFPAAIPVLIAAGAQLSNPCGRLMETPLLLAARLGRIDAMKELLAHYQKMSLEMNQELISAVNKDGFSAMEHLCIRLHDDNEPKEALKGIAMLLCHGDKAPVSPLLRSLLMDNRHALFLAIKEYTQDKPHLAANFLRKYHNKADPLHDIMYAKNSWSQTLRHLFGKADYLAFELEALIKLPIAKAPSSAVEPYQPRLAEQEPELAKIYTEDEIRFADFLRRYRQSLNTSIFNPWSEMLHLVAKGEVTCWTQVVAYADMHSQSRTKKIVGEMMSSQSSPHVSLDEPLPTRTYS